ncbi:ABC transporter permease [Bosea sp. Tri-44]|uniref:ABC transporter permease n=1 Tax=Bosea sp. Tri-44 TaxID=1972137 RepID=UPI00100F1088|nr:ABC transporter permease [Bosea sp. Tri-44]RXT56010.1 ABC transporter permease [Bosea sp. Tri-44]
MQLWLKLMRAPLSAKLGMAIVAVNVACVVFAPWLAPFGETEIVGQSWVPGFWGADVQGAPATWLGTDHLGRDVLTRLIFGARNSIVIALVTTILSFSLGITTGLLAAAMRGWVDQILSRTVDLMMGFPTLIFALMVLAVIGSSIPAVIGVIALLDATRVFRITRAVATDIAAQDYVEVARLRGEGMGWIMRREILPNAITPLAAEFGLRFCFVFLFVATLSFIGLGVQPPAADWGSMVKENSAAISFGILMPLFPAAAIALLTVAINLIIDWTGATAGGVHDDH